MSLNIDWKVAREMQAVEKNEVDEPISQVYLERRDQNRRRRIWLVIFACLGLLPLLTYFETQVFKLGEIPFPVSGNVLVFALININILLLLLMIFLVLRNLVQLVFERRRRFLGAKLRTKLVIAFVSLSLIPTGLLFFIALQFVSSSMDYWFNTNVEQSLMESLEVAKTVYQDYREQAARQAETIAGRIETRSVRDPDAAMLAPLLTEIVNSGVVNGLEVVTNQKTMEITFFDRQLQAKPIPDIPVDLLNEVLAGARHQVVVQPVAQGELIRGLALFRMPGAAAEDCNHVLIASILIPSSRLDRLSLISKGLEGYRQLMLLKAPIKTSLLVMLLIVTLLIVFCAIWFGFYMARGLTVPIGKLAEATRRVADGELDFVIEKTSADEMGTLVDSFNSMTRDILVSKQQLEEANLALRQSYQELDTRRRYTETILQNVAAGVISIDEQGRITTLNKFAAELLHLDKREILGRDYREVLQPSHLQILENFLAELKGADKSFIQRPIRLSIHNETFLLRINFTRLTDEEGTPLGAVLVFDNLTELEKAQRMAAWREVARRIAHEVKNPLTPIQLSAQRLRKKYLERLSGDTEVFDLCTKTIINQVEELKRLVGEFSNFARMPAVEKSMNSLLDMAREALVLYQGSHKNIRFTLAGGEDIPRFLFDLKQLKRVLINLLDNAVAALPPEGGVIEIELSNDSANRRALLEVRDNGHGVKDEDKPRLFEPYFSTKKTGTGLGLAIA
ncbi:MAG: PAS domain-containing sensor histidine kinase, partial [Deltaproteobacteria bacterium RIFOXYD12_FULL_50_9]